MFQKTDHPLWTSSVGRMCGVCGARAAMANFKVGNFPRENQY